MTAYLPGARVSVLHDGAWRRGTVGELSEARRATQRAQWPLIDWSRAVTVAIDDCTHDSDGDPGGDPGSDLVLIDPDRSERIRPLGETRHLRAVP